jgi:hypothetical protein
MKEDELEGAVLISKAKRALHHILFGCAYSRSSKHRSPQPDVD